MKEILNDVAVISLPHRDWSCEAVKYRIKLNPFPGETAGGNHLFVIIEDRYELVKHEKSRSVLANILMSRYQSIPARRVHFLFYNTNNSAPNGIIVNLYNFERDDNRQPVIKNTPVDYSANSAMCALVMF